MKRKLIALSILGLSALLVGCTEDSAAPVAVDVPKVSQSGDVKPVMMIDKPAPVAEKPVNESSVVEMAEEAAPGIDTSVFEYARSVDVVDARDINGHLTLTVWISDEMTDGLASNQALNQAWDFIQQDDVVGADTVTIGVMSGANRVFQFTVNVAQFKATEDGRMVDEVLAAATVDKISLDVLAFAEAFEWRIVK